MRKIIFFMVSVLILCSCSQFNQVTWQTDLDKRKDMIHSLTRNHQLEGMSEEEIVQLLGKPSQIVTDSYIQYLYYIGDAGFMRVSVSIFELQFDSDGKVSRYDIIIK